MVCAPHPVSYTHLDVYKRQPLYQVPFSAPEKRKNRLYASNIRRTSFHLIVVSRLRVGCPHLLIERTPLQQFSMRPGIQNLSMIYYSNLFRSGNGGQAMGNHNECLSVSQPPYGLSLIHI